MLPDSWSDSKTEWELNGAWNSGDFYSRQTNKGLEWRGTSPSGIKIEGYIKKSGTTAYPKYEGGK